MMFDFALLLSESFVMACPLLIEYAGVLTQVEIKK